METITKVLLLLFTAALFVYSMGTGSSKKTVESEVYTTAKLLRAHSSSTLTEQFKTSLLNQYGKFDEQASSEFILASDGAEVGANINSSFSTTTLQESHVDESDRIKTDGEYIYSSSIHTPIIKIFKASNNPEPKHSEVSIKMLQLKDDALLSGLYLRAEAKQLLAIASEGGLNSQARSAWFTKDYWSNRKTEVFNLDISNPTSPNQLSKLSLDGQLISSRRIGTTLYLVTRHTASIPGLILQPLSQSDALHNQQVIAAASMEDMLPKQEINGDRAELFDLDDCFYSANPASIHSQLSIISLLAVDLDSPNLPPAGQCFIGDAETVYSSANAIYLASTVQPYSSDFSEVVYEESATTEIHKFAINELVTGYSGSATIDGHLGWNQNQKPFRMSEKDGLLRVLSYVGDKVDSIDSPARLHILKESTDGSALDIIATLPNEKRPEPLGKKGERIYGSRFAGDRGYLVTFRTTDPLYILDLSDPTDPYILSALEVDGYSDYLQPVGENFLLGIGKDAVAQLPEDPFNSPNGAWYQGVKLSLIDISNPKRPVEKQTIILGKRGTETAVSNDHHGLTTHLKNGNLQINLPVSLHEAEVETYALDAHPSDYFGWTKDALYRFDINTTSGDISSLEPVVATMSDVPESADFYFDTDWQHDRSVIVGDHVYYLKRDKLFTALH